MKGPGAIDHSTITRWLKKFRWGCKNLNDQAILGQPKTVDFEVVLEAIEALVSKGVHTFLRSYRNVHFQTNSEIESYEYFLTCFFFKQFVFIIITNIYIYIYIVSKVGNLSRGWP